MKSDGMANWFDEPRWHGQLGPDGRAKWVRELSVYVCILKIFVMVSLQIFTKKHMQPCFSLYFCA